MTTRESVMRALSYRTWRRTKIFGSSRFGFMGIAGSYIKAVTYNTGLVDGFRTWTEVESCVASMIAVRPSVARVL